MIPFLISLVLLLLAVLLGMNVLTAMWVAIYFFVGIFIGGTARIFLPGRNTIGILRTGALGAVGTLAGGIVADYFEGGLVLGFILAVVFAAILIGATTKRSQGE